MINLYMVTNNVTANGGDVILIKCKINYTVNILHSCTCQAARTVPLEAFVKKASTVDGIFLNRQSVMDSFGQ